MSYILSSLTPQTLSLLTLSPLTHSHSLNPYFSVSAYHEAGHAVAGWNLEHADPLLKVLRIA